MIKKTLILVAMIGALFTAQLAQGANVDVRVGNGSGSPGDTNIEIPISVSDVTGLGIISVDLQLNYDSSRLTFLSLTTSGTIAQPWGNPVYNAGTPGQIKIAMYGTTAISGQGNLVKIYFDIKSGATAGTSTLTLVKANFGGGGHTSTIQNGTFTVIVQNHPPVLNTIGNKQIDEGATLIFNVTATDPDGDPLTYSASNIPSNASFNSTTRAFSFNPDYTQAGTYQVTFLVSDGRGGTDSETITITVNNVVRTYTLTISATNGTVSKNPNQTSYNEGSTVTLTATPNTGYSFTGWSGDLSGSANPATITMNANKTVTANFTQNTYTLTINAANGSVAKSPNQASYAYGTVVTLTATANAGYSFTGWSGDLSGSTNPATITMNSNKTVTANFEFITLVSVTVGSGSGRPGEVNIAVPITISSLGTKKVSAIDLTINYNSGQLEAIEVQKGALTQQWGLTANTTIAGEVRIALYHTADLASSGGEIAKLIFNVKPAASQGVNPLDLTVAKLNAVSADNLVDGSFNVLAPITYNLTIAKTGSGQTAPAEGTHTYNSGTVVSVQATPATGYSFSSWSGDASGSTNPVTITMDANKTVTANFAINNYTLTINATNGSVAKNPNQTSYNYGTQVTLTATANTGYSFSGWSGDLTGTTNPATITMDKNKSITANFAVIPAVSVTVAGAQGQPGEKDITLPISVSDVTGLGFISCDIRLSYDTAKLTLAGVTSNNTITQFWGQPTYNVVGQELRISLYGTTALTGSGNLVNLIFDIVNNAAAGDVNLDLTRARFNNGAIASTLRDGILTINALPNRPPVLAAVGNRSVDEGKLLTIQLAAADPDGDTLTYAASGLPAGASFDAATRTFNWTPTYTQAGNYNITFAVSDGSLTDSEDISITVNNINQPPVLSAVGDKTVDEGKLLQFTLSATDADGDTLTYSATNLPTGASFNASTRTFSWIPHNTQAGTYEKVHFEVSDGKGGTDSEDITIKVADTLSDKVTVTVSNAQGIPGQKDISIPVSATDVTGLGFISCQMTLKYDASLLTLTKVDPGALIKNWGAPVYNIKTGEVTIALYGTTSLTGSGELVNLVFDVNANTKSGTSTLDLTQAKFNDGSVSTGLVDGLFTILNEAPILAAIGNKSIDEGKLLQFTLSATDANADSLTYSASNLPSGATLDSTSGAFSWTPNYTQAGNYNVTFSVSDGALTDSEAITITVGNINQPPVLATIGDKTINEGVLLQFTISATDPDGDSLTYSAAGLPTGATLSGATFSWTPDNTQAGTYNKVHFEVNDGSLTDSEDITITVNDVIRKYKLTIQANNGSVTKSPNQETYDEDSSVILTAVPNTGYTFVNWSGDLSGTSNPVTILMDGDKSISAVFVDSTPPDNCSLVIEQDAKYANNPKVNLTIVAQDLGSGLAKMQFSEDGIKWSSPENYAKSKGWTLSSGDGTKTVYAKVIDAAGNVSAVFSDSIILDTQPPMTPIVEPIPQRTRYPDLELKGTKEANSNILINGEVKVAIDDKTNWVCQVRLIEGKNTLEIISQDAATNESKAVTKEITLKTKVKIRIISPSEKFLNKTDLISGTNEVAILYKVDDEAGMKTKVIELQEGEEIVTSITEEDDLGNKGEEKITLMLDTIAPSIAVTSHQDGQILSFSSITLEGKVTDSGSGIKSLKVNGKAASLSGEQFSLSLNLSAGTNTNAIEAEDNAGNIATAALALNYAKPSASFIEEETKEETVTGTSTIFIVPTYEAKKEDKGKEKVLKPDTQAKVSIYQKPSDVSQPTDTTTPYPEPEAPSVQKEDQEKLIEKEEGVSKILELPGDKKIRVTPKEKEKIEEIEEVLKVKMKKFWQFLFWKAYKLELEAGVQPKYWQLVKGQRLPFWLRLNGEKGIISGFVWGKKKVEIKLLITTQEEELIETVCKLEIK